MSAIAGVCYWDGRPVADALLAPMAPHLEFGGPDGCHTVTPAPGVVMQTYRLQFDSLSRHERQPHSFGQDCTLSWDGRLDNRDDLLIALHHDLGQDATDAALVAAAYTRWGLDAVRRLIGDWSLVIWDGAQRRLLLASDYMGSRPLYYLEVPGGIAWASRAEALADAFDLFGVPPLDFMAAAFGGDVPLDLTMYAGVKPVLAAHLVLATNGNALQMRRYWTIEPRTIRFKDLQDYADRTRELLIEGVAVRLRSNRRVWAHLSGGWDSSSLVCLADALIRRGQVEAPSLQPVSNVSPNSPESDESKHIEAIERWVGLTSLRHYHRHYLTPFDKFIEECRPGVLPSISRNTDLRASGDRFVLSGDGGDLTMLRGGTQVISLFEPLHEGRPLEFLRLCFTRARYRQRPVSSTIFGAAMLTYTPTAWRTARHQRQELAKRAKALGVPRHDLAAVYGITPELYARVSPRPRNPSVRAFPLLKRNYASGVYGFAAYVASNCRATEPDVWLSVPFSHRPLVEFIAGVPNLAFWSPVFERAGMRRALDGVLPPELLNRTSKGDPMAVIFREGQWLVERYLEDGLPKDDVSTWRLVAEGVVRQETLKKALTELANGAKEPSAFLRKCRYFEACLRARETWRRGPRQSALQVISSMSSSPTTIGPLDSATQQPAG